MWDRAVLGHPSSRTDSRVCVVCVCVCSSVPWGTEWRIFLGSVFPLKVFLDQTHLSNSTPVTFANFMHNHWGLCVRSGATGTVPLECAGWMATCVPGSYQEYSCRSSGRRGQHLQGSQGNQVQEVSGPGRRTLSTGWGPCLPSPGHLPCAELMAQGRCSRARGCTALGGDRASGMMGLPQYPPWVETFP